MARRKINSVLAAFIEMAAVAWADGCDAYQRGESLSANPYPPESPEHHMWRDGWLDAEAVHRRFASWGRGRSFEREI